MLAFWTCWHFGHVGISLLLLFWQSPLSFDHPVIKDEFVLGDSVKDCWICEDDVVEDTRDVIEREWHFFCSLWNGILSVIFTSSCPNCGVFWYGQFGRHLWVYSFYKKWLSKELMVMYEAQKGIASHHFDYRTLCEKSLYLVEHFRSSCKGLVSENVYGLRLASHHSDISRSIHRSSSAPSVEIVNISTGNWWIKQVKLSCEIRFHVLYSEE